VLYPNQSNKFANLNLRELFGRDSTKIAFNATFDLQWLEKYGIEVNGKIMDAFIYLHACDENSAVQSVGDNEWRAGLKDLAHKYLDHPFDLQGFPKEWEGNGIVKADPEALAYYAQNDAVLAYYLCKEFYKKSKPYRTVTNLEERVIRPAAGMETLGLGLDIPFIQEQQREHENAVADAQRAVYRIAGREFNTGSWQQLGAVLYDELKLPVIKKTKSGGRSTDESVLKELQDVDESGIIQNILDFRKKNKVLTTYLRPFLEKSFEGRLYGGFDSLGTRTGRFSSSEPNLQNIPRGDIRKMFVAKPGHVFVAADYSQVELRLLGWFSEDAKILKSYANDEDIHRTTSSLIFGEANADEKRQLAKPINFGVVYGISAGGLMGMLKAEGIEVSKKECDKYLRTYFNKYVGVNRYIKRTHRFLRKNGYVETILGRRRRPPGWDSTEFNTRGYAEREAVNAIIQGSSADIVKLAMVELYEDYGLTPVQTVHDELVYEVKEEVAEDIKEIIVRVMEGVVELDSVDLAVDANIGNNLYEVK
jgi:DNA polymerase-1